MHIVLNAVQLRAIAILSSKHISGIAFRRIPTIARSAAQFCTHNQNNISMVMQMNPKKKNFRNKVRLHIFLVKTTGIISLMVRFVTRAVVELLTISLTCNMLPSVNNFDQHVVQQCLDF